MSASSIPAVSTRSAPGAGPLLRIGLLVVLAAAAALSFDALRDLAIAVRLPDRLAWLLPIAIDAGAAVACATWLSHHVDEHTARFARRMTVALLALTVLGTSAQITMHAHDLTPPWGIAVAVGAVPPAVVGATVHLTVLVSRTRQSDPDPPSRTVVDDDLRRRAAELVDAGAGRPRIATELGLTDHQARRLVEEIRRLRNRRHTDHRHGPAGRHDDHTADAART